ncbi:MAG: hypothetical protein KGD73_09860 [Candidatus Lokiarchaeota archaeon]|nr:hypothetical protein [Candidatus Lokiarchaeota archaeon]
MDEPLAPELRNKIDNAVEKALAMFMDKVSKEGSLEELLKALIVEKVFSKLGPRMNRFAVRKVAKVAVRKAVDKVWESHRDKLITKLHNLK